MDIVFITPEVVPFSKVGGLADVTSALAKALRALGHRVHIVSLLYGSIDPSSNALARRLTRVNVPLGSQTIAAEVFETKLPSGVHVTLLNAPGLTDRPRVYGEQDDWRRFAFLCRGAVEWMRAQPKLPDIAHAHDWPAGLVPGLVKLAAETDPKLAGVKTVFTVHQLAAQGIFPASTLGDLGLPQRWFAPEGMEFYGETSWLKAGIVFADKLTTVSPTYAREITTPEAGERMDGALRARHGDLVGILNGVDFAVWNPSTDPHLVAHYDAEDIAPKERCRADLLARLGWTQRTGAPLIGMVGRLDAHKGVDLLLEAAPRLMRQDLSLVLLGEGEGPLVDGLMDLASRFPERVAVRRGFDEAFAHKIYAGSDLLLAPSRFEPSGLSALYAMRYGAVPIARATGGLRDAIVDADAEMETGTGFLFERADAEELYGAVGRALTGWQRPDAFAKLRRRAMRQDLSWERSARRYQSLYASLAKVDDEG